MAGTGRLIKDMIDESIQDLEEVFQAAKVALTSDEQLKMAKAINTMTQVGRHIDRIKEEFIRTIDECSP